MARAKNFLIQTIQAPARGSRASEPEEAPSTTSSVDMPSENTNRYRNPSTALLVVDTQVSTAAMTGAEQGAATRPETAPMTKAPENLPAEPAALARARSAVGMRTGMTSSMASAASTSTLAIRKYNHGLELMVPNSVPESPAKRPRAE